MVSGQHWPIDAAAFPRRVGRFRCRFIHRIVTASRGRGTAHRGRWPAP
jgi:hypothetical protein